MTTSPLPHLLRRLGPPGPRPRRAQDNEGAPPNANLDRISEAGLLDEGLGEPNSP